MTLPTLMVRCTACNARSAFTAFGQAEIKRWAEAVKQSGAHVD